MLKKKNSVILFLGIILGVLLSIGGTVIAEREIVATENVEEQQLETVTLPYDELRTFTEVFGN